MMANCGILVSLKNVVKDFSTLLTAKHLSHDGRIIGFTVLSFLAIMALVPITEAKFGIKFDYPKGQYGTCKAFPRGFTNGTEFDWKKLIPSRTLHWVACNSGRECARLEVPLDYSAPNGPKAAVALLRIKSKVPPNSKSYRGPVLFNPGGPGGSGVTFVDQEGEMFQQVLGDEFDIVGFDPRGVGETTPAVSVFSDRAEKASWVAGAPPLINSTADAIPRAFSRSLLFNQLVASRNKQAAQHVSTAVVARDMLSIVKAHGRDRLQYWGVSYGSVLGATYAAMFPDKVERLIIDGVVDFDDYISGSWSKSLIDTDKALQFLYDKCASAGPACPLHADSVALVQQRVEAILASVHKNPFPITDGTNYSIIDFTILKVILFQTLYSPFEIFPLLAGAMAALEAGNGQPILELFLTVQPVPTCDSSSLEGEEEEAQLAIECGEQESVANSTADIMQHFEELSKSSIFADVWTGTTRAACAGWKVRAAERFAGPFSANTSFPLLIIGNTTDPVTPLVGAQKAVRGFVGSSLLTINTPGHTSGAATSQCASTVIHDYFNQGKLPEVGKVCEIEDVLFGQNTTTSLNSTSGGTELFQASPTRKFQASRFSRFM